MPKPQVLLYAVETVKGEVPYQFYPKQRPRLRIYFFKYTIFGQEYPD